MGTWLRSPQCSESPQRTCTTCAGPRNVSFVNTRTHANTHARTHAHNNGHTFNWTETQLLDQAKTKHAREFKEAWHSVDKNTINRYIDIPPVILQLKNSSNLNNSHRRTPAVNNPATMTTTHPATTN